MQGFAPTITVSTGTTTLFTRTLMGVGI
jgi:hypothetical protein